jgi:hypothetical protein
VAGVWQLWGACADPDICEDGATEEMACGINGNGVQQRECVAGQWGDFGGCDDPDECRDGDEDAQACGINGRGLEVRRCVDGSWGNFGECDDPDVCVDGEEEIRDCNRGGGRDGEQVRTCNQGQWSEWGQCSNPDDPCLNSDVVVDDLQSAQYDFDTDGAESFHRSSCAPGGPERVMRFTLAAESQVIFDVIEADYDTLIFLRSDCQDVNTELACNDDRAPGDTNSRIALILQPGTYFFMVDGYNGAQGTSTVDVSVLPVECESGAIEQRDCGNDGRQARECALGRWGDWGECIEANLCVDAYEENNTPQTAADFGLNERADELTLCANLDEDDYYGFLVDEPTWVSASVDRGAWAISFADQGGGPLGTAFSAEQAEALLGPGEYLVRVAADGLNGVGNYSLAVQAAPVPFCDGDIINGNCLTCSDGAEDNDDWPDATNIDFGQHGPYEICQGIEDEDWFVFNQPNRSNVTVQAQRALGVGRLRLRYYNFRGQIVGEALSNANGAATLTESLGFGRYWLQVTPVEGALRYTFEIER